MVDKILVLPSVFAHRSRGMSICKVLPMTLKTNMLEKLRLMHNSANVSQLHIVYMMQKLLGAYGCAATLLHGGKGQAAEPLSGC